MISAPATRHTGWTMAAALAAALLAGCAGDDGSNGEDGEPGPPGPGTTSEATSLAFAVDAITIASPPVVEFTLTNEDGVRFTGLAQGQIRFTLVKLVPGVDGAPDAWQSYINTTQTKGAGEWGAGGSAIQATSDRNGTLVNNLDGTYTYTFLNDVTNITTPLAVSWEPTLTHRLGVQISGDELPVTNASYDFRPSDGATTGIRGHDVAQTASCNECHGKLALHGGGRIEVALCVTCHNPGSTDANSGNTVDMKVMIHKIHRGEFLPSVEGGTPYVIWGNSDSKHDYSEVVHPQDIRNCTKCHDAADTATPQGNNWQDVPSVEACGACHDDVNFATGANHSSEQFVAQNGECTVCHAEGAFVGSVAESHAIPAKVEGAKYAFSFVSVTNAAPGEFPVVTYKITDPTNANAAWDVRASGTDAEFTSSAASLTILLAWGTHGGPITEHDNVGNGSTSTPASALSLNGRTSGTNNGAPVDNGDGTYTITSTKAVPAGALGSGTAAFYGRAAGDFDSDTLFTDQVPIEGAVKAFAITDAVAVARRTVVDGEKCNACHDRLILHGQRLAEPQMCTACHNPDNTDVSRRGGVAGTDGLFEQTVDFKVMVHAIHGAGKRKEDNPDKPYVVYGFGNSVNDFSHVGYPGVLNNCMTCHAEQPDEDLPPTYGLSLLAGVRGTTMDSNVIADHADDINITPAAAVCTSCHTSDLAATHMEQNGASFVMVGDPGTYNETCAVCHGPGRLADVAEVHAVTP
jgi:OmcA/MtrC family decaheme c-type cytochrome